MLRRLTLVALATAALTACRDNGALTASDYIAPDTLVAYALTGTSAAYPSGLNTVGEQLAGQVHGTVVRVDGSANFDIAFDTVDAAHVRILPVRTVVSSLAGAISVGLQTAGVGTFDAITRAPSGYYRPDTAITVIPGEPFIILTNRNGGTTVCYSLATPQVYAKVVVDSINALNGTIHFRQVVNPNCGYRSFVTGLPTN
jgi:hypothetical protein